MPASIMTITGNTGVRTITCTASAQDVASGGSVTVTITQTTSGPAPPDGPNKLTYQIYTSGGTLISGTVNNVLNNANGVFNTSATIATGTNYLTNDNTATGSPRCGVVEMYINASCTTAAGVLEWQCDSRGGNTPVAGITYNSPPQRGWFRGTTTATTTLNAASYAYGDTITATTVLGAVPYQSQTVNVAMSPVSATASAASTTATFTTALGSCDNRFPASSGSHSTATTFPNDAFAGVPWTVATPTDASATTDPRLSFTHLMQFNDNTYGTPPMSKDSGGSQRLASSLAFLSARVTNANGVGISGITWTASLQDANHLANGGNPYTQSQTSGTQGGQVGWPSAFMAWSDVLPPGTWNKTCTITAPSNSTGLEINNTEAYQLVAANPNYRIICAGGPASTQADARHFTPGDDFLVGIAVINVETMQTLRLDTSPAPSCAIGRFNLTFGRAEFLASDGTTWVPATGSTVYFHPCTVSPGDANAWTKAFSGTQTAGWGNADIFIIGSAFIGGVPVNDFYKEIVVNGVNNHDAYKFDGGGFVGFPVK